MIYFFNCRPQTLKYQRRSYYNIPQTETRTIIKLLYLLLYECHLECLHCVSKNQIEKKKNTVRKQKTTHKESPQEITKRNHQNTARASTRLHTPPRAATHSSTRCHMRGRQNCHAPSSAASRPPLENTKKRYRNVGLDRSDTDMVKIR